ncbi:hypothetical protein [Tritonibacter scottomollicae]|uniref:Conjugal transfer protein TraN n=1 Tax=Tritonibacter scottomollicae TaxID=483013 RepID=A0A2T1AAI3_TRISK|nr:hypothetical protein [Tritonibacter scottomollicae]PRZ45592.1 hypothetical protein CLV89_11443 [Tritonibacter scottomollicae]
MRSKLITASALLCVLAPMAVAQSAMDRAAAAAGAAVDTDSTFQDGKINEVVTPFETSNPNEAGMNHTSFEDRILQMRDADNNQGRVLRATEDSAEIRPDVDIDGQGELFDDANWAHENADDIAGQYFTSESGSCTTPDVPVSNIRDEFCESLPRRQNHTCELIRNIWVDRTDRYRCDKRAANFVKVCEKVSSYSCNVNTNANACISRKVRFEGGDVTWNGNEATISLPEPDQKPAAPIHWQSPDLTAYATLAKHEFSISFSDRFQPSSVMLKTVTAGGPVQIIGDDGRPITTVASSIISTFGNPSGTWSHYFPVNSEDGLLVPMTAWHDRGSGVQAWLEAWIVKFPLSVDCQFDPYCNHRIDYNATSNVFETGWDIGRDAPVEWALRWVTNYSVYANVVHNTSVTRNVLRFLELEHFTETNPAGAERFRENRMTARVVYNNATPANGAAQLTFEFEGACCDSFTDTGGETCE